VTVGAAVTVRQPVQVPLPWVSVTVTLSAPKLAEVVTLTLALMVEEFTTVTFDSVTPVPDTFAVEPLAKLLPSMKIEVEAP
jgi:hypothetical protein